MSHYKVAVFTEPGGADVYDLLEPFNENTRVEPYLYKTRQQVIEDGRKTIAKWKPKVEKYLTDPESFKGEKEYYLRDLKKYTERMAWTDDEVYAWAIKEFYESEDIDENGEVWSTYNPLSKWDWYSVGGRWGGDLIVRPNPDEEEYEYCDDDGLFYTDYALASRVDFEEMRKQKMQTELLPYGEYLKNSWHEEEYTQARYPDEETYIKSHTNFSTYAAITPDGEWHAPGEMGWFGESSEKPAEAIEWEEKYYERFIVPAIANGWEITIVDCHI